MLEIMRENASGWIVKILFAIIIIVFVFAFGMSGLDTSNDPVLATVNDQVITRAEFEDAFQRAAENLRKANPDVTSAQLQDPQFKQLVLGELVNSRLLLAGSRPSRHFRLQRGSLRGHHPPVHLLEPER